MSKLYVAELKNFEKECPAILVYEHKGVYYDAETKEVYKTQYTIKSIEEIYININELIPLDEFLKEYGIDFKNHFSKRKINKLFGYNSRYTVYFTKLNIVKLFELSDCGITLHSEPANNAIVYQKKANGTLKDLVTHECYSTIRKIDKINQKYIGQQIKLQKFVNENYNAISDKMKKL